MASTHERLKTREVRIIDPAFQDRDPYDQTLINRVHNLIDTVGFNHPELSESVAVCKGVIDLLQIDSIGELIHAYSLRDPRIKSKMRFSNDMDHDFIPVEELTSQDAVFLTISNIFNRTDDLIETVLAHSPYTEPQNVGTNFVNNVLGKALIAEVKNGDNKKRYNFHETLHHAKQLAAAVSIDTSKWDTYLQQIFSAHDDAIELVRYAKIFSTVTYTADYAVDYRKKTIGNYAKLLSTCVPKERQDQFVTMMLTAHVRDDKDDILQDQIVQPNPYLALLSQSGLLPTYVEWQEKYGGINKFKDKYINIFNIFTNIYRNHATEGKKFKDEVKRIDKLYLNG